MTFAFEHRGLDLENNDPNIIYVGEWTTVPASAFNDIGNFGSPLSTTLHSTKTTSSFVFPFQGSSIFVYGTVNITDSANPTPTWQCSVDGSSNGIGLGIPDSVPLASNRWSLCNMTSIPDGSHELVVNITSNGMPFYLDYIGYLPSANVSLENTLIVIDNLDPAINYVSGWEALGSAANQTTDPNSLFNLAFVGIQISWYGFLLPETTTGGPRSVSSGEYSIDGAPFAPFQILNTSGTATIINELIFITPSFEMGAHVLSVKYTGMSDQTPLTLDYLIITNGSFSSTPASPSGFGGKGNGTGASNLPSNATTINKSSSNAGSIAGEVVGAIVGVMTIVALLFIYSRYRRKRHHPSSAIVPFQPFQMQQDRHSNLVIPIHKTSQISNNPTRLSQSVNFNQTVLAESSDSDSVGTHLFHTRIPTPFNNNPLLTSTSRPSELGSTNATDVQQGDNRDMTHLVSPIVWRENEPPPSYTTN